MISFKTYLYTALMLVLLACDDPNGRKNGAENDNGIYTVGNGLSLSSLSGIIADFSTESGDIETGLLADGSLKPLVLDRDSGDEVSVQVNWLASGEKDDPVLQIEVKDPKKRPDCAHFETLQNAELVCRKDLEGLSLMAGVEPAFLENGDIVFLNPAGDLSLLRGGETFSLMTGVVNLLKDQFSNLAIETHLGSWIVGRLTTEVSSEVSVQQLLNIPGAERFFLGEDRSFYYTLVEEGSEVVHRVTHDAAIEVVDLTQSSEVPLHTDSSLHQPVGQQEELIADDQNSALEVRSDGGAILTYKAESHSLILCAVEPEIKFVESNEPLEKSYEESSSSVSSCEETLLDENFMMDDAIFGTDHQVYIVGAFVGPQHSTAEGEEFEEPAVQESPGSLLVYSSGLGTMSPQLNLVSVHPLSRRLSNLRRIDLNDPSVGEEKPEPIEKADGAKSDTAEPNSKF